jgi:hypothetical protein
MAIIVRCGIRRTSVVVVPPVAIKLAIILAVG